MSNNVEEEYQKPKNPAQWVDTIGLRGAVAHLAELVYANSVVGSPPWEELPDNVQKPEANEATQKEANLDPSGWQISRMPENQKQWKVTDARNFLIADKFQSKEVAQQYVDWGRANRKTLTAKPNNNAKKG